MAPRKRLKVDKDANESDFVELSFEFGESANNLDVLMESTKELSAKEILDLALSQRESLLHHDNDEHDTEDLDSEDEFLITKAMFDLALAKYSKFVDGKKDSVPNDKLAGYAQCLCELGTLTHSGELVSESVDTFSMLCERESCREYLELLKKGIVSWIDVHQRIYQEEYDSETDEFRTLEKREIDILDRVEKLDLAQDDFPFIASVVSYLESTGAHGPKTLVEKLFIVLNSSPLNFDVFHVMNTLQYCTDGDLKRSILHHLSAVGAGLLENTLNKKERVKLLEMIGHVYMNLCDFVLDDDEDLMNEYFEKGQKAFNSVLSCYEKAKEDLDEEMKEVKQRVEQILSSISQ